MSDSVYGGIEAGGTKFVCVAAGGPQDIREFIQIETTTPQATITQVAGFFMTVRQQYPLKAIGIGSFGPVDLDRQSPTCGFITTTPKPGWKFTDLAGIIHRSTGLPVMMDTDVNTAALGEGKWGAAHGVSDYLYLTVGTGIGGGAVVNGEILHGLMHPEMGHMFVKHDRAEDPFEGSCPYHLDCLEGLASGFAIQKRWGRPAAELAAEHPAWALEARYLAEGLVNLTCVLSPVRIVIGGGVTKNAALLPAVRNQVKTLLNGYLSSALFSERIDEYLVAPGLGDLAGVLGAVALAGSTWPLIG